MDISPVSGAADGAPERDETSHDLSAPPEPTADTAATEAFLDSLPELSPGRRFRFACHPNVPCFNACCNDLQLILSPYDVLRLRRGLALGSTEFLERFTTADVLPGTGFPVRRLEMLDDGSQDCPFVRAAGCSVYDDRPAACRTYPLGRTAQLGPDGAVRTRLYVVREPHCRGFDAGGDWSGPEWLADQGLAEYNAVSDRYSSLIGRWSRRGAPLSPKQRSMVELAVYRLDRFQAFLRGVALLDRLELADDQRQAILADEERCLQFALDWLEQALLSERAQLRPRAASEPHAADDPLSGP
jgi:Fe-S-cluster containining protein